MTRVVIVLCKCYFCTRKLSHPHHANQWAYHDNMYGNAERETARKCLMCGHVETVQQEVQSGNTNS